MLKMGWATPFFTTTKKHDWIGGGGGGGGTEEKNTTEDMLSFSMPTKNWTHIITVHPRHIDKAISSMFQSVAGLVGNPSIETLLRLKRAVGDQSRFGSNIEETGRVESNCQRSSRTGATCHNKLRYEPRLPMLCEDFENGGAASDDEIGYNDDVWIVNTQVSNYPDQDPSRRTLCEWNGKKCGGRWLRSSRWFWGWLGWGRCLPESRIWIGI